MIGRFGIGLEVVYLLLFPPNKFAGPIRLLWRSDSGRIDTNKETRRSRNGLRADACLELESRRAIYGGVVGGRKAIKRAISVLREEEKENRSDCGEQERSLRPYMRSL